MLQIACRLTLMYSYYGVSLDTDQLFNHSRLCHFLLYNYFKVNFNIKLILWFVWSNSTDNVYLTSMNAFTWV